MSMLVITPTAVTG